MSSDSEFEEQFLEIRDINNITLPSQNTIAIFSTNNSIKPSKTRKKHHNSKIGCAQCKSRKMKCDEQLPECRQCRVRLVKIPCSFLSFTEDEKVNFIKKKERQNLLKSFFDQDDVSKSLQTGLNNHDFNRNEKNPVDQVYDTVSEYSSSTDAYTPESKQKEETFQISMDRFDDYHDSNNNSPKNKNKEKDINKNKDEDRNKNNDKDINPSSDVQKFTLNKIKHQKRSFALPSQTINFLSESYYQYDNRMYFTDLLSQSFDNLKVAFSSHLSMTIFWIIIQLRKQPQTQASLIEISQLEHLGHIHLDADLCFMRQNVGELIKTQASHDYTATIHILSYILIPTCLLQVSDILRESSLKVYYFEGTLSIINEFLKSTNGTSILAKFAIGSSYQTYKCLYFPAYSSEVLYEILDVLNELWFISTTDNSVNIKETQRDLQTLISFIEIDVLFLINDEDQCFDPSYILNHPARSLYSLLFKFFHILPPKTFCLNSVTSQLEKTVYLAHLAVSRVLDNLFPEARYISQYQFIGPVLMYPFSIAELRESDTGDIEELLKIMNYFLRILTFFNRRCDYRLAFDSLKSFPDYSPETRFLSRAVDIEEVTISKFRNVKIRPEHYPHLRDPPSSERTRSHLTDQSDLVMDFNTLFTKNLNFGPSSTLHMDNTCYSSEIDVDKSAPAFPRDVVDFLDIRKDDPNTGFLNCDYDPLEFEWKHIITDKSITNDHDSISLKLYMEDREILLKEFLRN